MWEWAKRDVDEEISAIVSYSEERTSGLNEVGRGGFDSWSMEEIAENPGAVESPVDEALMAGEKDGATWNAIASSEFIVGHDISTGQTAAALRSSRAFSLPLAVAFEPIVCTLNSSCIGPDGITGSKESNPCGVFCVT
jgi:hypothetical protein